MEDNENATETVVKNGEEVQMSQKEITEAADTPTTRVVEGTDGKKHILSRMNG